MPVASAPAAFSVIEKQIRFSPFNSGLRNFSFWYSVPCSRIVSIEASSGPCVFIESAPSMLSPSSICTGALASGPTPMPPYSFGTKGHHSPRARAFFRKAASTSSNGFESSSFSAGRHSSCTHLRTFSRIALASAGTSKSSDMAFPHMFLLVQLVGWHNAATAERQRQTKFEAMPDLADLFPGYEAKWINTSSGRIFARVGGNGPPLLLLHGFSSTHVMWHRVAPQLADKFTLIIADLPGYGWSDMPESDRDHIPYTKRAMAKTIVEAMEQLGHVHFALAGHDRGGRVSYRLALDHPGRLSRLAVLDILPTYNYWERMNRLYALKIYHWTFLAQPHPLPETLISAQGEFFLRQKMASQTKSKTLNEMDPRALEHYIAPFRDPARVHAMCEDYRAGAYADYEIDKADFEAGKKITIPMLALWGDAGIASAAATPLDTWKTWATNVTGSPVDSGHFLTEEAPEQTAKLLREFFLAR